MYIKREPLGRGNLAFGKRKKRVPFFAIIAYLLILVGALYLYINMRSIQPQVLSALGPDPLPTAAPQELVAKAQAAHAEGDTELAVDWYRQAAALSPDDLNILFEYGQLLVLVRQHDEALTVADHMILIAPEDVRGYTVRTHALDWMGEYSQAQIAALKVVEIDPSFALGHAYLAEAYVDLGRLGPAREQAEIAVDLDPFNVEVRRVYAMVLEYYGDYQGAIQQYIQSINLEPNRLDLWYGLALNYRGAGQFDKSIETFAEIAKRTPNDPNVYVSWGRTYFIMRDDDAAQATLQQAIDLVCQQGQEENHIPVENQQSCPYLTSDELFDERAENTWLVEEGDPPLESQLPWVGANRNGDVPPRVLLTAWNQLGQVYNTRRNYEDAIAILSEAIAWGENPDLNNPDEPGYQELPIELYYVLGTAYYYKGMCHYTLPLARTAFEKYERDENPDVLAINNILKLFVLCRDYPGGDGEPIIYEGAGFGEDGFPDGYDEPSVLLETQGTTTDDDEGGDE